jgi:hypothetical protein
MSILKSMPDPSSFPPCNVGRDLKYSLKTPEYNGPFVNMTNLDRTGFDHSRTRSRGLADIGVNVPVSFSWKDTGGNKIEPQEPNGFRNQMACGSCWAFTTASILGDRYAIKHKVAAPYPSVAYLLSCVTMQQGGNTATCCLGGNIQVAAQWLSTEGNGTKTEDCWPYSYFREPPGVNCSGIPDSYMSPPCLHTASLSKCCASCCGDGRAKPLFTVSAEAGTIFPIAVPKGDSADMKFGENADGGELDVNATIRAIQLDIMKYGPIATSMKEPPNFNDWWNLRDSPTDVFVENVGGTGGHAVCLTGWGETSKGVRWWEMRNSWGDNGKGRDWTFCRFKMTTDDMNPSTWCGIDVPIPQAGSTPWGGCISFQAGDKVDGLNIAPGRGGSPGVPAGVPAGNSKVNWKLIGISAVVVLVTLILIVLVVNHNQS